MKSFDIDKYNSRECQVHNHGFYLGEQSKQAEIDELIDTIKTSAESEMYLFDELQKVKGERDELRKRIDICERLRDSQFEKLWNLTKAIQFARNGADEDFDLFLNHIDNILKGDQ